MNKAGFIKNKEILEEDYRVNDLLDYSNIINDFRGVLERIDNNAAVGLIGDFGSGKSTMLYQLYKKENKKKERWINFDAWKFPGRKELWEGFVLEVVKELDKGLFNKVKNEIDGKKYSGIKNLIKVIFRGGNIFLPGLSIGENLTSLFNSSPIRRVFEFQEILSNIIIKENKDIYIIIEDIDRSGDKGIFFLETLKNFIKENQFNKKIIVIVPIGTDNFEKEKDKQSYLKVLDHRYNFKPKNINFEQFIKSLFKDDFLKENKVLNYLNYFFRFLLEKNLNIRGIKHILREANIKYQKLKDREKKEIDIRTFILFSSIVEVPNNYGKNNEISVLIDNKRRIRDDFWGKKPLLRMIYKDADEKAIEKHFSEIDRPFFIQEDVDKWFGPQDADIPFYGEKGYIISSKYLKLSS
ncbi:MAG: hypothetical protein HQ538_05070 [Parcubacteria group bacterium]|nr:hypothetical protein [Parcubacteria group bacterium]